jgi:H+/Cl- antiporter ClcA
MANSNTPGSGPVPDTGQRVTTAPAGGPAAAVDPVAVIRSKPYIAALVLAAIVGIPISAIAYGFLALVAAIQKFLFSALPNQIFGSSAPAWWPVPWLVLSGLLTALTIRYLPGNGGHSPAFGFKTGGGPPIRRELPGIALAALTTLGLGAVLGPEAPLIAIGGGLGALAVHLVKKDAPPTALTIMASAGSFAAVSTLLGSPVLGAFLIMEVAGIGGSALSLVALPGLLASGIGALVFIGLDSWTGLGTFSLALPVVPPGISPTLATMGWALVMGAVGALLGWLIRSLGLWLRPIVHVNRLLVTSALGLLIGLIAMSYQLVSGRSFHRGAVLRTRCSAKAGGTGSRCSARRHDLAHHLQGPRVRNVAERVSRRPGFPINVHRRGSRYCSEWTTRHGSGTRNRQWVSAQCVPQCCDCR